ncbi:MAG: bifunctional riboflavin kinase/FAD synthetase [Eubacterium sp.]
MKIVFDFEEIKKLQLNNSVVTIGKFDGIHKGHDKLLVEMSKKTGMTKIVITFLEYPERKILTENEKESIFKKYDVDILFCVTTNKEFFSISAGEFVESVLVKMMGMKCIVSGSDFRFGKDRKGDVAMLKKYSSKYNYEVISIEKEKLYESEISSTLIRELIKKGNIEKANEMLGYPYAITGKVIYGKQLGRKLGFPTVNIMPDKTKVVPLAGVYKSEVLIKGKIYPAITNVGDNPTVDGDLKTRVETHIFNFSEDVYGENLEIHFLKFVRGEITFDSVEKLKERVAKDIEFCERK